MIKVGSLVWVGLWNDDVRNYQFPKNRIGLLIEALPKRYDFVFVYKVLLNEQVVFVNDFLIKEVPT